VDPPSKASLTRRSSACKFSFTTIRASLESSTWVKSPSGYDCSHVFNSLATALQGPSHMRCLPTPLLGAHNQHIGHRPWYLPMSWGAASRLAHGGLSLHGIVRVVPFSKQKRKGKKWSESLRGITEPLHQNPRWRCARTKPSMRLKWCLLKRFSLSLRARTRRCAGGMNTSAALHSFIAFSVSSFRCSSLKDLSICAPVKHLKSDLQIGKHMLPH
jgi:hypothetical protein